MNTENNALVEQIRVNLSNRPTSNLPSLSFDKWTALRSAKYIGVYLYAMEVKGTSIFSLKVRH